MKIFGLGMPELLIILGVALLIFGPKHLPELGSALGKTIKNLRSGIAGGDEPETETAKLASAEEVDEEDQPAPQRKKKASRASKEEAATTV